MGKMYLTTGLLKGRQLEVPQGIRPTQDRIRKALFDILQHVVKGSTFLELYAGSGAVGFEALSNGAKEVVFVEKDNKGRVLLGKYSDIDEKFTETLGWVDNKYVIKNREPVTVGYAVKEGFLESDISSKLPTVFSKNNQLFLRVVSKPEVRVNTAKTPGGKTSILKKGLLMFQCSIIIWYKLLQKKTNRFYSMNQAILFGCNVMVIIQVMIWLMHFKYMVHLHENKLKTMC